MMTLSPAPAADEPLPGSAELGAAEPALVQAAAAGDGRAFEQLVRGHYRRVFVYLMQLMRHRQDAEDVTQQTFVKAHQHLARFDPQRPLINWLLTIARRTALNHFRGAKPWEHMPAEPASAAPSPAQRTEQKERAENLWTRARRVLSAREYEVLWLRFAEDLSIDEVAQVTGLTRIHVKVLVHRARQRLLKGGAVS